MSTEYRIRLEEGEVVITRREISDRSQSQTPYETLTAAGNRGITLPNSYPGLQAAADKPASGEPSPGDVGGEPGIGSQCAGIIVVFGSVNICCGGSGDLGSGEGSSAESGGRIES